MYKTYLFRNDRVKTIKFASISMLSILSSNHHREQGYQHLYNWTLTCTETYQAHPVQCVKKKKRKKMKNILNLLSVTYVSSKYTHKIIKFIYKLCTIAICILVLKIMLYMCMYKQHSYKHLYKSIFHATNILYIYLS